MKHNKRRGIDELLRRMNMPKNNRRPRQNTRAHIGKLQQMTVYGYYDMPFTARSKGYVEAMRGFGAHSTKPVEACREWLYERLETYIGQLIPGASIKTLTMKALANTISEALEDESLPLGKRMEWYELCFVLTAEMDSTREATDSFVHDVQHDKGRAGVRLSCGAPILSRKVEEWGNKGKGRGKAEGKRSEPVEIDVLLRRMNAGEDSLSPRLFFNVMDSYIFQWNQAKVETSIPDDSVAYLVWIGETEFRNRAKCFGLPIRGTDNVVEYTSKVVERLLREKDLERYGRGSLRKICRLYELCYELIHLMADYDMGLEHRTLMEMRQNEFCDEGEELMEYEIGESERMNRIADELLAMTTADTVD